MKSGIILWKREFRYPNPFSPVHRSRKFSAVLGTMWAKSSIVILPRTCSSVAMSKNTRGLSGRENVMILDDCAKSSWRIHCWQSIKTFLKDSAISAVLNFAASCSTFALLSGKRKNFMNVRINTEHHKQTEQKLMKHWSNLHNRRLSKPAR